MWSEVCHRERRQLATWTSFGRVAALGAAAGGIAMSQSQRFARCWYTTVIARAVLLYRSHSASRGAAMPQSSLGRCCSTIAIALRAVLLCHSHCASRCAATPQSSHHAVLLCHSHRFARCWCSTDTALRAVLLCYATVIYSVARCWVSPLASVIAWCGAGSSVAGAGG